MVGSPMFPLLHRAALARAAPRKNWYTYHSSNYTTIITTPRTLSRMLARFHVEQSSLAFRWYSASAKDPAKKAMEEAQRLQEELNEMLTARQTYEAQQRQLPLGHSFFQFFKSSKEQLFNILFAFACVLLAHQVSVLKGGVRKLMQESEEKDKELEHLRGLLKTLSLEEDDTIYHRLVHNASISTEPVQTSEISHQHTQSYTPPLPFARTLSQKCAHSLHQLFQQADTRVGYTWILAKRLASGDALEMERLVDVFQQVVATEIRSVVGDAMYTKEESKEKRVRELLAEKPSDSSVEESSARSSSAMGENSAPISALVEILEDVHSKDLVDKISGTVQQRRSSTLNDIAGNNDIDVPSTSTVKRTRYAI